MESCIGELERFLHSETNGLPVLLRAAFAHVQFETIHPFLDGNGRLGRLLIALVLHHGGLLAEPLLYLSLFFKENRPAYYDLLGRISDAYVAGQVRATQAVNGHLAETYWQIGRDIVEFEQGGKVRAEYGKNLLTKLSRDLTLRHGKGFSRSNVIRIRQFYVNDPKGATASHLLTWSHWVELLKIEDAVERRVYEQQSVADKWTVRELQRQMKSSLFLRLAAGKDKDAILQLSQQGESRGAAFRSAAGPVCL